MNAAHEMGVQVPDELSRIGFDDVSAASIVRPQLTTLRHPITLMAQAAVQELMRRIQGQPGQRQRVEFPAEMVVRESTAPASAPAVKRRARKA
jgi:LacI family transcriptional regulator